MGLCEGVECDDGNECTDDTCQAGMCEFAPVEDGMACDEGNECTVGTCADGGCDSTPVADDTPCGDDAGTCQQGSCRVACDEQGIRDAIAAGGGPYTFACDGPTTVVTGAEIVIDNNVILDGEGNLTVDGNDDHRVFLVTEGVTAELHGLTVTNGRGPTTTSNTTSGGGGIRNHGTLTVTNCTVSGNSGGNGNVGGIFNFGILTLTNSTVSGNSTDGNGGGIANPGTMTVTNCTVSGNSARALAGGIANNGGTLTLTNSTVSGNSADENGGGIANNGTMTVTNCTVSGNSGGNGNVGGIFNFGILTLTNSVVDGDCGGDPVTSGGYNIESPGDTCGFDQGTDQVDVTEGELNLGPLQDNGGPTETHDLSTREPPGGSVAVDVIPEAACVDADGEPLTTDQRGFPRPSIVPRCDVGALEFQQTF